MANIKSLALKRIDELVIALSEQRKPALQTGSSQIDTPTVWRFMMTALQATRAICSENSPHYIELHEAMNEYKNTGILQTDKWLGILQSVSDDLRSGMLSNIQELIAAEVFTDLSEMAGYLSEQGYHLPAIAIAGAVLEDALRKICLKNGVEWSDHSSIAKLNMILYKTNVYDKVQFGQIEAWGKLRNKVDHGDFTNLDEISAKDTSRFIDGIQNFVLRYLV